MPVPNTLSRNVYSGLIPLYPERPSRAAAENHAACSESVHGLFIGWSFRTRSPPLSFMVLAPRSVFSGLAPPVREDDQGKVGKTECAWLVKMIIWAGPDRLAATRQPDTRGDSCAPLVS